MSFSDEEIAEARADAQRDIAEAERFLDLAIKDIAAFRKAKGAELNATTLKLTEIASTANRLVEMTNLMGAALIAAVAMGRLAGEPSASGDPQWQ